MQHATQKAKRGQGETTISQCLYCMYKFNHYARFEAMGAEKNNPAPAAWYK